MEHTHWTWNWTNGGYNSCSITEAPTLAEAKKRASSIGTPPPGLREVTLMADPKSFRKVTMVEMAAINRSWCAAKEGL